MVYYMGTYSGYSLQHHGILGMKWGKRNGPPYPLDTPDHSASEKKAGWRKSLSKSSNDSNKSSGAKNEDPPKERKKLTSKQKRNIAATVAALAVIGGTSYYLYKSGKGKDLVESGKTFLIPKEIDREGVKKVNAALRNTPEGSVNCMHCSISDFLNSHFGMNTTATGYYGVDETSGLKVEGGRQWNLIRGIFDNVKSRDTIEETGIKYYPSSLREIKQHWKKVFDSIPAGSEGIMSVQSSNGAHAVRYFKNKEGITGFIDPQTGKTHSLFTARLIYGYSGYIPSNIMDLTNATLRPNAGEVLKYIVNGF